MSSQFESRRYEIESKIKKKKNWGIILIIISVISFLIIVLFNYINNFLSINKDIQLIFYIIFLASLIIGYEFIYNPVDPHEYAFYEIVEAMRLIEKSGKSEDLNQKARKRVLKAYKKLSYAHARTARTRSNAPWYSEFNEKEKLFIKNLKMRIAPAFNNDTISPTYLLDIAIALQGRDISLLENVNISLKNQLDEINEETSITARMRVVISNYMSSILSSTLGTFIFTFIIALFTVFTLLFAITMNVGANIIEVVKKDPIQITGYCVVTFVGLFQIFRKKSKTSEV